MFKKFVPKVGKVSLQQVAKKTGLTEISSDKFRKQAVAALHKEGFNPTDAKSILSGNKKLDTSGMKRVFNALNKEKIINKSGSAVNDFVKGERGRQTRIYNTRMSLREQEIKNEKAGVGSPLKNRQPAKDSKFSQPAISYEATGQTEKITTTNGVSGLEPAVRPAKPTAEELVIEIDPEIAAMREEADKSDLPID